MKIRSQKVTMWLTFICLLVLFIASILFVLFQGGFVSWFLFGSFLPIALYAILLHFYPLKNCQVERMLKQSEYQAGEKVIVKVRIQLPNRFPLLFLYIEDIASDNLQKRSGESLKSLVFPFFQREITYTYEIDKIPRGEYIFHHIHLETGDLFGIVRKEVSMECKNKLIVYPSFVEMLYNPFENQFELGMTATKDKVQRDSTMAISLREYNPGDKFSWIHWKQSARKNSLMTKEFEQRQSHDLLLVLDRTPNKNFDLSVTLAASIVRSVLKKGAQVGLYSFGTKRDYFPPRGGQLQLRTLNYHLACVVDDSAVDMSKIMETDQLLQNQNQTVVFLVTELQKSLAEIITGLSMRHGQVVLFVVKAKKEKLSKNELGLIESVRSRGIMAKLVYEDMFAKAFEKG